MKRLAIVVAAALLGDVGHAAAQSRSYSVTVDETTPGFQKLQVSKATVGDAEIRLWSNTAIDPDCRPASPGTTLTVVQTPAHGTVRMSDEPFYAAFPPNNPRSACNRKKVPGHQAFYKANPDFHGHDLVVLQGSSPDGRVREISFDVEVR